jgi:threonine dehydrogenase-like Zn-dependent dehydrogenase
MCCVQARPTSGKSKRRYGVITSDLQIYNGVFPQLKDMIIGQEFIGQEFMGILEEAGPPVRAKAFEKASG